MSIPICSKLNSTLRRATSSKMTRPSEELSFGAATSFRLSTRLLLSVSLVLTGAVALVGGGGGSGSDQLQSHQMKTIATMAVSSVGAGNNKQSAVDIPQASSREIEKQIVDRILGEGYDKRIRPAGSGPHNASRPGEY